MRIYNKLFNKIIKPENLFSAWDEFKKGKGKKFDVLRFEKNLEQNIFQLHRDLRDKTYKHGGYTSFYISDPKLRHIHKATVRDRVLHHAVFQVLNPIFEPTYIHNSFSCRIGKGNHKGVEALAHMLRQASKNNTKTCFVLKCDVRKFFDSVDQNILIEILDKRIKDEKVMNLIREIIGSFVSTYERERESIFPARKGIPIGNLTSQIFANIYMNEFDQFVKHKLKVKHYARYTDDFVIIASDKTYLENLISPVQNFLKTNLCLELHPKKIHITKHNRGVDFLGYVILPEHIKLRTKTKQRILRKIKENIYRYKRGEISELTLDSSLQSYLGVLSHADAYKLSQEIRNKFWFWLNEQ
ncbi:group II intron reverse transcriptase domain-containing protein [Candidatus Nomurabacteria bacterium]|nr:group II intron reverse transcriptase domain-containing protein [Candidatus Nomurabacteria bacterium]